MKFVDVVLPLPLKSLFTYSVPEDLASKVDVGYRVIVSFGSRKYYTAIVLRVHDNKPIGYKVKDIEYIVDSFPLLNHSQIRLWEWVSFYYMCSLGDVYIAAVPSKFKLENETYISLIENEVLSDDFSETEARIVSYLQQVGKQKISKLSKELNIKDILASAYFLVAKGLIEVQDDIIEKYRPKTETYIRLNDDVNDAVALIGKANKQLELYNTIKEISANSGDKLILKSEINELGFSQSVIKGLFDKSIITQETQEISRLNQFSGLSRLAYDLNDYQREALAQVQQVFAEKNVCLLHGVTSSGKTEIYIHLILDQLKSNKQVLYLVPEIMLTTQLTQRLQAVFGDKLVVYHSKINDNERAEIWLKMQSDSPFEIVIGVRSSIFLPFQRLSLVIVDEEHEVGYKQMDTAPRYNARDVAIVISGFFSAKTLLGSATPAIETYFNAVSGKYGLVTLSTRHNDVKMPVIELENTSELRRKKIMKSVLTPGMISRITEALENRQQAILFRNRRGFASILECRNCGWTPKCKQCDVSLTYHKMQNVLRCHYCNTSYRLVDTCPACNERSLEQLGMGTEMLAEEVAKLFPKAVIGRMDADTTKSKSSYEVIINRFQNKEIDILVGTQMLSKGLDFEDVGIVGIVSADALLNYPNFRSHERGFQLMMQAAGRAGRKDGEGRVVIQAADPTINLFNFLKENDYISFYAMQIAERKLFNYPPYTRLISVGLKHRNEHRVESGANYFATRLRQLLGNMVLGPNKPVVSFIKRSHIREILLKIDINYSHKKVREQIKAVENEFLTHPDFKYIDLYYDVDMI